jgi:adenosine kinase
MDSSQKLIFAIGNPLLDISAECPVETLEKYALNRGLACLAEEKHKELFEELWKNENSDKIPGGSAMNVLRCANFMLKGNHPNSCMYFGSISDDDRGKVLKDNLDQEKIQHDFSIAEDTYTGACAVVVNDNERSLCADLAACLQYKTSHLDENIEKLKDFKILYSTGFFITSNPEALKKVASFATENDITFGFNLSAVFLIEGCKQDYLDVLPHTDIVFGNEDEADAFGKAHEVGSEDRKVIAEYIAKSEKKSTTKTTRTVIIHQGAQDVIVSTHNFSTNETTTISYPIEKMSKEELVDTNSAGDSFAGGYLAATALGHDQQTALKAATYCARYILKTPGCQFPRENEFEYPQ